MNAMANRPKCQATQGRFVGADGKNGDEFYEIGCQDGASGYMLRTDSNGKFKAVIECALATRLGGGCTFTNVSTGQTTDIATYQSLAKQIKDPCTVTKYQSYGAESGGQREVVQLACSDASL